MKKDTVKTREKILEEFLYNLYIISNKSYQKRVWIEAEGPEVHSFDNAACDFFDLGEYIFDNYEGCNITERQQKMLDKFRKEFGDFLDGDRPYLPEDFIDTPEWENITTTAKEALEAFNYEKNRE